MSTENVEDTTEQSSQPTSVSQEITATGAAAATESTTISLIDEEAETINFDDLMSSWIPWLNLMHLIYAEANTRKQKKKSRYCTDKCMLL